MSHPVTPKAVPSSTLNAKQEVVLWVFASIGFLAILVMLSALFQPDDSSLPGPKWLTAPVLGWVIGHLVAFAVQPHKIKTASYVLLAVGLVLVVICSVVFQGDWVALGRGVAGFVIGLIGGILILRALHALRNNGADAHV